MKPLGAPECNEGCICAQIVNHLSETRIRGSIMSNQSLGRQVAANLLESLQQDSTVNSRVSKSSVGIVMEENQKLKTSFGEEAVYQQKSKKLKPSLLPVEAVIEGAKAMQFGAEKYTTYGECDCNASIVKESLNSVSENGVSPVIIAGSGQPIQSLNAGSTTGKNFGSLETKKELKYIAPIGSETVPHTTKLTKGLEVLRQSIILLESKSRSSSIDPATFAEEVKDLLSITAMIQRRLEDVSATPATLGSVGLTNQNGFPKHLNTCASLRVLRSGVDQWREVDMQRREFIDALERHLIALKQGETHASDSNVSHLGHIIANAGIILAKYGK